MKHSACQALKVVAVAVELMLLFVLCDLACSWHDSGTVSGVGEQAVAVSLLLIFWVCGPAKIRVNGNGPASQ